MAAQREATNDTGVSGSRVKRRGLIAGAAALAAGLAAVGGVQAPRVAADGATWTLPYNSGSITTGSTLIYLINSGAGMAVFGNSASNIGIYGSTSAGAGTGVSGVFGYGGNSGNFGVHGSSPSGYGVFGQSAGSGVGVFGQGNQYGVVGNATLPGGYGVYGLATVTGTAGFAGGTNNASAYAAVFGGRVVINDGGPGVPGGLIVNGSLGITGTKSAIVPDGSGGHRLMYCVEAPESWFEDFGEGALTGGKAEVHLAADFASTVDTSTLHVFCMPHDEQHVLHLTGRSATGFTVSASASSLAVGKRQADLNGTFTYRVVAKRKDVEAPRLAKVDLPQVKLTPPPLPPPVPARGTMAKQ